MRATSNAHLHRRPGTRRARPRGERLPRGHLHRASTRTSTLDEDGLRELFRQFSFPGGIPSHVAPETPGSIHEGGELGYALAHAVGAAFDNPEPARCLRRRRRRGRDRAAGDELAREQVPEPARRRRGRFRSSTSTATRSRTRRCSPGSRRRELVSLLEGYGWRPIVVAGDEPMRVHQAFAAALDEALDEIARDPARGSRGRRRPSARSGRCSSCARRRAGRGPKEVDGLPVEGTWRAHQVPVTDVRDNPDHLRILEDWLRSYRPEELFDDAGQLVPELVELPPRGERRMSANPHANGGGCCADLVLPDFRDYAVEVAAPGTTFSEATRVLGALPAGRRSPPTADDFRSLRPRRDRLEPARRGLRGDEQGLGSRDRADRRAPGPARTRRSRCCPSISARAGSRATC